MIDLHTHSFLSDGALIPSELLRRAEHRGIEALAITDHVDASNLDFVVPRLVEVCRACAPHMEIRPIPGAEITHAPPGLISKLAERARELGAAIVIVHGETPAEPVRPGTNRAALEAPIDFLAHPGLITPEEVALAREREIALEITARRGHNAANGHVARLALELGAELVLNTDAHEPADLIDDATARTVLLGAGIAEDRLDSVFKKMQSLANEAAAVLRAT
ncbi:MAG: histidinol phosphate phosphatase domain-containing protein [Nitrospinota bacterium]